MSKIGRQFNPAVFQQSRSEGSGKSKNKSSTSESNQTGSSAKSTGKGSVKGGDDLPSVGLGGNVDNVDVVDQYMGNGGAAYADEAADHHNQIGTKAARGELLSQQGNLPSTPQNQQLLREVDTLRARLAKLEGKIQANATEQTSPTQGVQRVAGGARQIGRAFGGDVSRRKAPVQAENVEAVGQKQNNLLDDDLPRVGLK